nr:MAG TPA: holin [Caudoviricetes sp.]
MKDKQYWVKWGKAAGRRALKTAAQTFVATIGTTATIGAVDWKLVCSTSALAAILSIGTSLAGLPEVEPNDVAEEDLK